MSARPKFILLCLASLLVVAIAVGVLLPYVNRLVYPTLPPLSKEIEIPANPSVLPDYRDSDNLGAADRIRSEPDARAYVEALVKVWGPHGNELPGLPQFEDRLARAEYAAVRDPQKRIPEFLVAKTFNELVNLWGALKSSRVTVEELHAFRIIASSFHYSRSVARLADGSVGPDCRPTEALVLLNLLDSGGGIQPWLRERVRNRHWPWKFLMRYEWRRPRKPTKPGLRPLNGSDPAFEQGLQQRVKFDLARRWYLTNHPAFSFVSLVSDLFGQLGIV